MGTGGSKAGQAPRAPGRLWLGWYLRQATARRGLTTLRGTPVSKLPLIVAEMSGNHNQDLARAHRIIDSAADAGCGAVKFQTYRPDTLTIRSDRPEFKLASDHALWGARQLWDLYEEAHTPWEWHQELFSHAAERDLVAFSSPFDATAVELLESLDCPMYKVASAELVDDGLLRVVAATGKPVVLSTGIATMEEIAHAVGVLRDAGCVDLTLLACTASYPAEPAYAHLANIGVLRGAFGTPVGLSDHTLGVGVSLAAVALGAVLIEKHFTVTREDEGVDSQFSMDESDMRLLVREARAVVEACRTPSAFGPKGGESTMLGLRRSLYCVQDVKAGTVASADCVRSIRPADGLAPRHLRVVLGRRFSQDVKAGTPLSWDHFM